MSMSAEVEDWNHLALKVITVLIHLERTDVFQVSAQFITTKDRSGKDPVFVGWESQLVLIMLSDLLSL